MLSPLSRVSSHRAISIAARLARPAAVRTFMAPTVSRRADFVQELYLKELKAYKPTPVKDSDAQGHVATFSLPQAPKSPEETDLAASLQEYESMAVEVEGNESPTAERQADVLDNWFDDEEDVPAAKH